MPPKRRRRFQGLYYHSSPPKVLPMNDQGTNRNGRGRRDVDDFSIKLSTIRIWMHEKDIGKLTRILWAGQGNRLRQQASTNPRVKRFLAAVPYVMNSIKEVHQAVIDNNLETLQAKLEPPVPPALITGKDANGLNLIHKAAGLGHTKMLEYLISAWPGGANETDITGKTPLHWAASAKNNMRCYTLLTQAGCDEEAVDYKSKTPSYYRHKPQEIERAFLVYVPEAPRVSPDVITDWEALSDDNGSDTKKTEIKAPLTNGINGRSIDDSVENTSEVDLNDGLSANSEYETNNTDEVKETEEIGTEMAPDTAEAEENQHGDGNDENNEDNKNEEEKNKENITENENIANTVNETDVSEAQDGVETNVNGDQNDNEEEKNGGEESASSEVEINKYEDTEDEKAAEVQVEGNGAEESKLNQKANDCKEYENSEDEANKIENGKSDTDEIGNNEFKEKINDDVGNKNADKANAENDEQQNPSNEGNLNGVFEVNENDDVADVKNNEVEKTDEENGEENNAETEEASNETVINIDDVQQDDFEKIKPNKVLKQDQETGERTCERKSAEAETEFDNSRKPNSDNVDEDEDEDVVVPVSAEQKFNKHEPQKGITTDEEPDEDENSTFNDDDQADNKENELETNAEQLQVHQNTESPTPSLAIEGFVHGESEDNTVQSQSAALVDEDARIQEVIASGDMEQLAQIVLNGDGSKLLDMQSTETDIQAFLNNVPNYMSKIRRVHEAAREGSLLCLQQALDRRKFAIAKDEISPNGATPLHVAVLFGHKDIVRYLAARFPETTTITDNDGRTALHYAAVIKDNGYFYNMLKQLGANSKTKDKIGNAPEFYFETENSDKILTYRQLLSNFGAEELEAELLSDQGEAESHSFHTNPIFKTEQGKYLANTLAEPLIEALTEIANKRPGDPVSYLTNYLQSYMRARNPRSGGANSSIRPSGLINTQTASNGRMNGNLRNTAAVTSGDDIEVDDTDNTGTPMSDDRDEHGQSMLHFACARSHRRGGLMSLIEESNIDITYRDELYRTARDVSLQANQPANAKEIDRYVLSLAVVGDLRPFENFAKSGYDHIIDIGDDNEKNIVDIASDRGHEELAEFLRSLRPLEEFREELHQMIRDNNIVRVKEIVASSDGHWVISAKNYYGRTALHIAVLKESEELVEYFVESFPDVLKIGDNLERSPLHYAMGTNAVESLSRILINKGAKRTAKDLKGRQPSYYFMNKADILRLQEEEDENR